MDQPSTERMRALVWEAPHQMNLREIAIPKPNPEEVLVRVAYVGICGSELSGYLGLNALRVPPLVMGHEFSGEIAGLGSQAQEFNPLLRAQQRVTVNPMIYCRNCDYCQSGQNHLCTSRRLIGAHRPGAFSAYTTVPSWMVNPLPDELALREGALSEPLACAVHILRLLGDVKGQSYLVAGSGPIGLFTLQVLLLKGAASVFISEPDADRRQAAMQLGGIGLDPKSQDVVKIIREATGGTGAAAAVDAVGKAVTRQQCVAATRTGGRVILSGLHEETSQVPVAEVIRREISLLGSFCYTPADFQEAINWLSMKAVGLDPWVVEAELAEGSAWFERLSAEKPEGVAKVLLIP